MATVKQLIKIAEEYNLGRRCRDQHLVYKRFYLFSELRKELTLESIGKIFNVKHCSVIHGLKQHESFMKNNDRVYINTINDVFQKVNKFDIRDLHPGNMYMEVIEDEDSFITLKMYLNTKHPDLYRDNQGIISREILKEMI